MAIVSPEAEQIRMQHRRAVASAAEYSRLADQVAEERRQDFYRALDDAHGNPADGKLTHAELAEMSGWGRGWVRLAIANHRKRQERANAGA